jgi:hypothetical protein
MAAVLAASLAVPAGAYADVATETPLPMDGTSSGGTPLPIGTPVASTPAPVIVVTSYSTSVERVTPGSAFDLELTLYNATSRRADNVVVVLGSAGGGEAAGAAIAGGLTVLETGNAKYVGTLKGQREVSVSFRVIASPGTTPGALNVPVTVSFEHGGARQDVGYTVGILIERQPTLSLVTAEVPDAAVVGEAFPVSFEVANASGFALSGVTLSVEASGGVVADGTVFLGSMDAAITEIIDATVTAEKAGDLEVMMVLSYRDDFGRQQTFRESRTVTVTDQPENMDEVPGEPTDEPQEGNWFTRFFKALFGLGE